MVLLGSMNLNKGCIEMDVAISFVAVEFRMNLNKGCIEIYVAIVLLGVA